MGKMDKQLEKRFSRCTPSSPLQRSPECVSVKCPYIKEYGNVNRFHFQKQNGTLTCFTCGSPAKHIACNGVKVWEYINGNNFVTIMHNNMHTCAPKMQKADKSYLKTIINNNLDIKPNKLVNDQLVQLMSGNEINWNQLQTIADTFVDMKRIHNQRAESKDDMSPDGNGFDALAVFKSKCDIKGKYYIYKMNYRGLNGQPSYVFKSSEAMARICLSLDREGSHPMNDEYVYVDAKHNRCRNYKTLTLWTLHKTTRKLVCLAVMEVEAEDTENLTLFWRNVNSMLREVSGNDDYVFNPTGLLWMRTMQIGTVLKLYLERILSNGWFVANSITNKVWCATLKNLVLIQTNLLH